MMTFLLSASIAFATISSRRTLVLLADSTTDPVLREQRARLQKAESECAERDLDVVVETERGAWHDRFAIKRGFAAVLVGKDGGEKWRTTGLFEPGEVFELIDGMPMRRREKRTR